MSTLLEQASLVMIPSGYKEDVVYSQIPTSGAGDLSFTRASNGTRVNSAGLVEVCPWNLLDNSNSFTSGAWVLQEVTSTSGQSDPLGGSFGWRFNETTATGQHRFYYGFIAFNTGVITQSIYVKSLGRDQIWIGANSNAENLIFTFSTETISSVTGFTSTSATNVGGGWYRITATFFGFSPINCLFVQGYNGGLSYAGDTAKGFYAFGGQLNIGATAKPYFPTTDRLNVPRLTYQNGGGGCPSLLLEKQSTNLVTYSEDLTNAVWLTAGGITVTANATTSPDGTQNADLFNHGSFSTYLYQNLGTLSGTITTSIFVKKGSQSSIAFGFVSGGFGGGMSVKFNLDTQTFSGLTNYANFTSITATYESYGNGWYRLNLTGTTATSTIYYCVLGSLLDSFAVDAYLWGAQVEASSYPTSYIPTTSSSATRVADACFKTGISSLIGQTEGTIFYQIQRNNTDNDSRLQISDGTTNNWLFVSIESGLVPRLYCNVGGVNQFSVYGSSVDNGFHKVALAYKNNDFKVYIDGVASITQTSGSVPTCSVLSIANTSPTNDVQSPSQISQAILFPTRLTNAELASLTTI